MNKPTPPPMPQLLGAGVAPPPHLATLTLEVPPARLVEYYHLWQQMAQANPGGPGPSMVVTVAFLLGNAVALPTIVSQVWHGQASRTAPAPVAIQFHYAGICADTVVPWPWDWAAPLLGPRRQLRKSLRYLLRSPTAAGQISLN